jgi:hypothetical protein
MHKNLKNKMKKEKSQFKMKYSTSNFQLSTFSIVILFSTFYFLLSTGLLEAAEIRLDSQKVNVKTGEQFVVDVRVNSDESLNAVEGRLTFPTDVLSIKEIREGNSVLTLWIEKPYVDGGEVMFSGIAPGGFSGPQSLLFSLVFEAESVGEAELLLLEATALRNDGLGTNEPVSLRNVGIVVKPGDSKPRTLAQSDTEPPEDFIPIISSDPNLFDGKQTLVFATQDKGTGILRYDVKEFRFPFLSFLSRWTQAESPYVLGDQELKSHITIRAVDFAGNERVAVVAPRYPLSVQDYFFVFAILIIAFVVSMYIFKLYAAWKGRRL